MNRKILLLGTSSSGKTTLVKALEKRELAHVSVGHEIARQLLEAEPTLFKDPNFQHLLFAQQLAAESALATQCKISVWDNGVVSNLAYSRLFAQDVSPADLEKWARHSRTYQKIYLLHKDDIRYELTDLQRQTGGDEWQRLRDQIHEALETTLQNYELAYEILQGTPEQRLAVLETEISHQLRFLEGELLPRQARK